MPLSFQTEEQSLLWQIVQEINDAWLTNKTEQLINYFHPGVIITGADLHEILGNRDAAIGSYKEFMSNSVVNDYKESDPVINVFGDTAIVSYQFNIVYVMNEKTYSETGRDLFVFNKENDKWLAVWRTLVNVEEKRSQ
jgi:hypothetical protein